MFGVVVADADANKAERIIRKFVKVQAVEGHSTIFLVHRKPVMREICMQCMGNAIFGCPLKRMGKPIEKCPVDVAIDATLIGFRALQYGRVKAKIVFPAP